MAFGPAIAVALSAALSGPAQAGVQTIDGKAVDPFAPSPGVKATVFIFTSTDCPISNRYAPEVRRIVAAFAQRGVAFRLVYPNPAEQPRRSASTWRRSATRGRSRRCAIRSWRS